MFGQLQQSDAQILTNIVEHANTQYLHESRVYRKSSFNILRMLSSYKALADEFKLRKENIYNWIIFITKQYNPQTMKQWINAINSLSNNSSQFVSRKTSIHDQSKKRVNTTINEFYRDGGESFNYSKINSHHSTTRLNSFYERPKIKDFEFDSRDKIEVPVSCKMHYISFEPEDKENINYDNRMYNHPTKTPGEQSFIMNLPNSNGSPFYLSKITNNTKDATQFEEEEQYDEEWELMKSRADIFYSINSKMKSFSALMANFQAFDEYQQTKKKANYVFKQIALLRVMKNLKKNWFNKNGQKKLFLQMDQYFQMKLKKKSFKILKVFRELRISQGKHKTFDLRKANPVAIDFMVSLMMMPLYSSEECSPAASRVIHDTPKSIKHKAKHFQETENCEKIQLIFQYFSRNLKLNKQQIQSLFIQHNISRLRKSFNILKQKSQKRQRQIKKIHQIIKKRTIRLFAHIYQQKHQAGGHILMMNTIKDRQLKEKCFKILLQLTVSKKIYAKREEYIKKKNMILRQKQILQAWKSRLQIRQLSKFTFETRVMQGSEIMKKTMRNKIFSIILDSYMISIEEENNVKQARNLNLCQTVFNYLKDRVKHKKLYLKIRQSKNKRIQKNCLNQWKKSTLVLKGTDKIRKWFNNRVFQAVKQMSQFIDKQEKIRQIMLQKDYHSFYRQLRISYNSDRLEEQKNVKKIIKNVVLPNCFKIFWKYGSHEVSIKKNQQRQIRNENSLKDLLSFLKQQKTKYFMTKLKQKWIKNTTYVRKTKILSQIMSLQTSSCQKEDKYDQISENTLSKVFYRRSENFCKKQFLQFLHQSYKTKQKTKNLRNILDAKRKKSAFNSQIKNKIREISTNKKCQLAAITREKATKKQVFKILRHQCIASSNKIDIIQEKINKRLKFNGLYGLAKMVIRKDKRINQTRDMLKNLKFDSSKIKLISEMKRYIGFEEKKKMLIIKINSKIFIKSLMENKNKQNKKRMLKKLSKIRFLHKLAHNLDLTGQRKSWEEEKYFAYKKLAVEKVNRSIVREILRKKAIYMAIKFRAIHLCKLGFKSLILSTNNQDVQSRTFKLHEHFSTQYSSI